MDDEKRIWSKLKPEMRNSTVQCYLEILHEAHHRVVKKSLFFLTHFSFSLQSAIALKLVKRVFQPNERLGVDPTCQSMYIIDKGKADLQLTRSHFSKPISKTLRTINGNEGEDKLGVSNNAFGSTAFLLRRPTNLTALSREFIVTYELAQKDFNTLITDFPSDFEAVCQLRDRILSRIIIESH